jgi:hypothetical protein
MRALASIQDENGLFMTTDRLPPGKRLDSWKAIAEYLGRDVGTVRRWERSQGLPVQRVPGGRGSSVFAYASDIDAWLQTAPLPAAEIRPEAAVQPQGRLNEPAKGQWLRWAAAALAMIVMFALGWRSRGPSAEQPDLRAEISKEAITAFDGAGRQLWQYRLDDRSEVALSDVGETVRVIHGADPAVYGATHYRWRRSDAGVENGELTALSSRGETRWTFSFPDSLAFGGKRFEPPWAITTFAVSQGSSSRRVAVAAHHYVWGASLVAVLDDHGRRVGTFAHSGWIEAVRWLTEDRLLIGGFSESHDGGMVGLVDTVKLDAQGPEPPGSAHYCDNCGTGTPHRMMVMPRSEINRLTRSRFNRAVVQLVADRVVVRTIEVPWTKEAPAPAEVIYEFTPNLELIGASFGQRYWDIHAALEAEGKVDHTKATCPDRDGPREMHAWAPETGWRTIKLR